MRIKVKCECGATGWGTGRSDVQGDGLMTGEIIEITHTPTDGDWEGGKPDCPHDGDLEIVELETDYDYD